MDRPGDGAAAGVGILCALFRDIAVNDTALQCSSSSYPCKQLWPLLNRTVLNVLDVVVRAVP